MAGTSPHLCKWRIDRRQGRAGLDRMTNTIALYLGIVVVSAIGLDIFMNDGHALIFMTRRLLSFIEYVAFWH
jgi:hypothetical protein